MSRQQWGPGKIEGAPEVVEIVLRRYQCQRCFAVMRVGPRGLVEHHRYSAAAIAMAICLWLVEGLRQAVVRLRISPWFRASKDADAERKWRSLGRWSSKIASGRLWSEVSARVSNASDVVMATIQALAASVPAHDFGVPLVELAFAGAAHRRGEGSLM